MQNSYQGKIVTIVGLGKTGLSCIDYFLDKNVQLQVIDTRANPVGIDALPEKVICHTGSLNLDLLLHSDLVVISPGLALATPEIQQVINAGVEVVGDIELFCREAKAPIIAITGSNGKSTVTTLTAEMAKQAGLNVGMGGNIGIPALSLLNQNYDVYVLELSSFQLETTFSLKAKSATILNISEDHLDRYDSLDDYRLAKLRIYENAEHIIVNAEDKQTYPLDKEKALICFAQQNSHYHFDDQYLYCNEEAIIEIAKLKITGRHNLLNALASIALSETAGISRKGIIKALQSYTGLSHRFQLVPTQDGVTWINDSKATNIGSTIAALNGLNFNKKLYLLLGGDGKGADFSELKPFIDKQGILCYCFGKDKQKLAELSYNSVVVNTMEEAISQIKPKLVNGDIVLLSPACASLDQFKNFEERGNIFMQLAQGESNV